MAVSIPPLDGAADPNAWHFLAAHGPLPNPVGHTFPLVTHNSEGQWRLIGTGFYISRDGLFVTAKHVVEDVLNGVQQARPLAIFHLRSTSGLFGPQEYLIRPIMQCWLGEKADIALGVAAHATNKATGESLSHWSWPLSWATPSVGTSAGTYAFPNHAIQRTGNHQTIAFRPDAYLGTIQEVANYRDRVMVPYPYLHADFRIHGGASGGPIFGSDGAVIGINCTELKPEGPGFGAQIRCLQDAFIDDAILLGEQFPRRVTFSELVRAGVVAVADFMTGTLGPEIGTVVRLDTVPITANGPSMEVIMYS